MSDEGDAKGKVFKVAKRMVQDNKDIVGSGAVKDSNGGLVVDSARIKDIWREYHEKMLNEDFDQNRVKLVKVDPVIDPAEEIKSSEVREAVAKSNCDKAPGPSGIVAEMLKAAGEVGVQ